jgi:hypothetical protein
MRICLFAGPGAGKSNAAAEIYSFLNKKGYSIDLVHEYIKEWAYLGRVPKGLDQFYIFAKQMHKEDVLNQGGVKNLVTDSPLLMQVAYAIKYKTFLYEEMLQTCLKYEENNPSLNLFLSRESIKYKQAGRYENLQEAIEMDVQIENLIKQSGLSYQHVNIVSNPSEVFNLIEESLTK